MEVWLWSFERVHVAWLAHEGDSSMVQNAHATVRHIVRRIRQANSVTSISSSALSLTMSDGSIYAWNHDTATTPNTVKFGITTATDVLSEGITSITFVGYEKDGTTVTTTPADIHLIRCTVSVQLPRSPPVTKSVSSYAWIRSW